MKAQKELELKQELYYKLIDSIVDLQDAGLGSGKISELQDYANGKISEITTEIADLE